MRHGGKMQLSSVATFKMVALVIGFMSMVLPAQGEVNKSESADRVAIVNGTPIDRVEFEGNVLAIQKNLLEFGKPLTCKQVTTIGPKCSKAWYAWSFYTRKAANRGSSQMQKSSSRR